MAIVEKYCYGLSEPCGGKDQVNGMISIDITRLDHEATRRADESDRLSPYRGELKLNPVVGGGRGVVFPMLNTRKIGKAVPIEIGDREG